MQNWQLQMIKNILWNTEIRITPWKYQDPNTRQELNHSQISLAFAQDRWQNRSKGHPQFWTSLQTMDSWRGGDHSKNLIPFPSF
jgi:hypothetical protein